MDLSALITEMRNPNTMEIDCLDTISMLTKINDEDQLVAPAVRTQIPAIAKAVDIIAEKLQVGGRLIYIGAGTSGRLGVLDASECPPTFGVDPEMVLGLIAGGEAAIRRSVEGAEDNYAQGQADLKIKGLTACDVVVGLAASGRTPYVLGALQYAKSLGAVTIGVCCVTDSAMQDIVDILIAPVVGPEVITGSTRLKAGTAQKLVLNMLSTGAMIKLGKVYSNLMVDLQANNEKLLARAKLIVKMATGASEKEIERVLQETGYNAKLAVFMLVSGLNKTEAEKRLKENKGHIRRAME